MGLASAADDAEYARLVALLRDLGVDAVADPDYGAAAAGVAAAALLWAALRWCGARRRRRTSRAT